MDIGHPLYLLPFDHRESFTSGLLGVAGPPDRAQRREAEDLKMLIWDAFEDALDRGAPRESCGVLVDEEYGADVARFARAAGVTLAMPVEKSGLEKFELAYDDFADHIADFEPDLVKVLVRYNPEDDPASNRPQETRLACLSSWLRAHHHRLLFELLVPPTAAQQARAGDELTYEHRMLPGLIVDSIAALQNAGIEPDIWKIQGIDDRGGCEGAAAQARSQGRDDVTCIVLGHGADVERVRGWLSVAAGVPGYAGFAAGRTIWHDPLADYLGGRLDRDAVRHRIADNYLAMIDTYRNAANQPVASTTGAVS
ncbi:2-deoxy-5-keto-D-gluconate 6-phosphate aldolase domain-containing protein [Nocardia sp. NPDC058058]|uniref:2-deoxy-5-keto-D-gluconate 6-phosphate aldolase domain-containing protein n=1 Tax=Nocardia sp. NPDC058058 TaxID=3346317 RepID=UPI0036DA9204